MDRFDRDFIQEMKGKLNVDLLGVVSIESCASRELKEKAVSLLPGARSVLIFAKEIYGEVVDLLTPSKGVGEAELGELLKHHSDYLNGPLNRACYDLASLFRKKGHRSLPLTAQGCPTDKRSLTAVFSYKHAASLAGLGSIGKHSLLITPEHGPRVRLSCLLTEANVEASPVSHQDHCIQCDACIRECPAQALKAPADGEAYSINKFSCQTYRQSGLTCGVCMKACAEILS